MYIARQPIFNRNMEVYSYELLYRASIDSSIFVSDSLSSATATILAGIFENGDKLISDNKKAFVNFDENMLLHDFNYELDSSMLVAEILETVNPTRKVIDAIKKMKQKGYWIALDDFEGQYSSHPLVEYANIIKYDLIQTPLDSLKADVKLALNDKKIILAEKVESQEEFIQAKEMGFHLFQGYFFQKPYIVSKSENKAPNTVQYSMILAELNEEEPSYDRLTEILQSNIDLVYKILKLAGNSKENNVDSLSIKKALTYMGLKELKFWVSILMIKEIKGSKPPELVRISLIRAKFSELLSTNKFFNTNSSESFLMGMFSVIDALLNKKMSEIVEEMPFSKSLKDALLDKGGNLNDQLNFIKTYEEGNFKNGSFDIILNRDKNKKISNLYYNSIEWANNIYNSIS